MVLDAGIRSRGRRSSNYLWSREGNSALSGPSALDRPCLLGNSSPGKIRKGAGLGPEYLSHAGELAAGHEHNRLLTNTELPFTLLI